jgi:hypothetical protein
MRNIFKDREIEGKSMRGDFLRLKASFMIFLIVFLAFSVTNLDYVAAEGVNGCCELTTSGEACVYTDTDNCEQLVNLPDGTTRPALTAQTTCDQAAFCEPGVCISDIGQCSESVSKATCEQLDGYTWQPGAGAEYPACQKNCCVIGEYECSYTTEKHCSNLITGLEDISLDWRDVDSESSCTNICQAAEKGCCASENSCSFGARAECEDPTINFDEGTGFFSGELCSSSGLGGSCSDCVAKDHKGCVDEDVYWFDSCGNQEEVVQAGDVSADGLSVRESGNCNYLAGGDSNWCGFDEQEDDYRCKSVTCSETFNGEYFVNPDDPDSPLDTGVQRNPHDDKIANEAGEARAHGESWCLYESPAGGFKDIPGSQHYRTYCYFGEQIIEPCTDYREEVCIQNPYTDGFMRDSLSDPIPGVSLNPFKWVDNPELKTSDQERGAACIPNDNDLFNPNITTVPKGSSFWSEGDLATTCGEVSFECPVLYSKFGVGDGYFNPARNTQCLNPGYVENMSFLCQMQGDCGVSYNLVGALSTDSFYTVTSHDKIDRWDKEEKDKESRKFTKVGFDIDCDGADKRVDKETGEVYCIDSCKGQVENGSAEDCEFVDSISEVYSYDRESNSFVDDEETWKENLAEDYFRFGVYGNLIGLSQEFDAYILEDESLGIPGGTLALGIMSITAGALPLAVTGVALSTGAAKATEGIAKSLLEKVVTIPAGTGGAYTGLSSGGGVSNAGKTALNTNYVFSAIQIVLVAVEYTDLLLTDDPLKQQQKADIISVSSTVGASIGVVTLLLQISATSATIPVGGWIVSVGAILAAASLAVFSSGGQNIEVTITTMCEAWQPPTGSEYCSLCDIPVSEGGLAIDDGDGNIVRGYECSEYKCRSLGQSCEFITENVGSTRPKCIGIAVNDVNHPEVVGYKVDVSNDLETNFGFKDTDSETIGADPTGYLNGNFNHYAFTRDTSLIVEQNVEPYQTITFGIELDEPGQCKLDENVLAEDYETMALPFPDTYFDYRHEFSWVLDPAEEYDFYVRCQDHNGNVNIDPFVIRVETNAGNDVTAPLIETTSIINGAFMAADKTETEISIFVNEPVVSCYWNSEDVSYELMTQVPGNQLTCGAFDDLFGYECNGLIPINSEEETNKFYFACEDKSGNRNTQNYELSLIPTVPLVIDVGLPEVIVDSAAPQTDLYFDFTELRVETSAGAQNGKAICSFEKLAPDVAAAVQFVNTDATVHTQPLVALPEDDGYLYEIECKDVAENVATTILGFNIKVDSEAPELVEIHLVGSSVHFTLDDVSDVSCKYNAENNFVYDDETEGAYDGEISAPFSFAAIEGVEYHVKCQDTSVTSTNELYFVVAVDEQAEEEES